MGGHVYDGLKRCRNSQMGGAYTVLLRKILRLTSASGVPGEGLSVAGRNAENDLAGGSVTNKVCR